MMDVFPTEKIVGHLHDFVRWCDGGGASGLRQLERAINNHSGCVKTAFELQETTIDLVRLLHHVFYVIVELLKSACKK